MSQLTYADRELFLDTFDALKATWREPDEVLLDQVCARAKTIVPDFGFEHSLVRDLTLLCRFLANHETTADIAELAKGALIYFLGADQHAPSRITAFGLLDDSFVASYSAHEIRSRLGEKAQYSPPRLQPSERRRAEDLFLIFCEHPLLPDDELIQKSREVSAGLKGLAESLLYCRLCKNINFLITVVADSSRSREHRACARAGLSYVVCTEDAIGDRLGLVGYLDDSLIAQIAVDLIEPSREPWLELLDATVAAWPFLNAVVLDEDGLGRPVSEFMIVNSALACPELRGKQDGASTFLVVPHTGPVPFLLGFVSALGLIQDFLRTTRGEPSFVKGQRVIVDNDSIRIFAGIRTVDGREEFGLTKTQPIQTRWWPISELGRLAPADTSRSTRGRIVRDLRHSDAPLTALELLFITAHSAKIHDLRQRVFVVTRIAHAHELATRVRLHGYRLCDAIPMGSISMDGDIKPWSSRFGTQEPVLIFASDLDPACARVEECPDDVHLVLVDASGANAARAASLSRLRQLHVPAVVVVGSNVADAMELSEDSGDAVWEWKPDDFKSLLWPEELRQPRRGRIAQYERRIRTTHGCKPQVRHVSMPLTVGAFRAIKELQALAEARAENPLMELEELVSLSFRALSRLLRCVVPDPKARHLLTNSKQVLASLSECGALHGSSHRPRSQPPLQSVSYCRNCSIHLCGKTPRPDFCVK